MLILILCLYLPAVLCHLFKCVRFCCCYIIQFRYNKTYMLGSHISTSLNWCSLGTVISVAAHRCIRALRIVQTEQVSPQLYTTLNRRTCSSLSAPRITTHYTVHPRDKDSRWEGKTLFCRAVISLWDRSFCSLTYFVPNLNFVHI